VKNNIEIEYLKLYAKDLDKIITKLELKVQKEKDTQADKLKSILEEYPTEDDVMNAFGWGFIAENKKDKILTLFKNKFQVDNEQSPTGLYLNMLRKDLRNVKIGIMYPDTSINNSLELNQMEVMKKLAIENENLIKENHALKNEKNHNERGAGRKSKFTDQEQEMIKMYRIQGQTIKEIAASFDCSIGLIHKLIHE